MGLLVLFDKKKEKEREGTEKGIYLDFIRNRKYFRTLTHTDTYTRSENIYIHCENIPKENAHAEQRERERASFQFESFPYLALITTCLSCHLNPSFLPLHTNYGGRRKVLVVVFLKIEIATGWKV